MNRNEESRLRCARPESGKGNEADNTLSPDRRTVNRLPYRKRVKLYEADKARLPRRLSPEEYQEAVITLARRWRI